MQQVISTVVEKAGAVMLPRIFAEHSVAGMLRAYIESNLEFLDSHRNHIRALMYISGGARRDDGKPAIDLTLTFNPAVRELENLLRSGQEQGEFREFSPRVMAVTIRSAIDTVSLQLAVYPEPGSQGLCERIGNAVRRSHAQVTRAGGGNSNGIVRSIRNSAGSRRPADEMRAAGVARPAHNLALGYLRGFLVVLVLAHHSVLAYIGGRRRRPSRCWPSRDTGGRSWWWILTTGRDWSLFTGFNDDFFMSLMFFLSGLFVWSSLKRKGNASFVGDRLRRLGIPFFFAAAIVAPDRVLSVLPADDRRAQRGRNTLHELAVVWRLADGAGLVYLAAARIRSARRRAVSLIAPNLVKRLDGSRRDARQHPLRFFLLLFAASAAAIIRCGDFRRGGVDQHRTVPVPDCAAVSLRGLFSCGHRRRRIRHRPRPARTRRDPRPSLARWTIAAVVTFVVSVVLFLIAITKGATMSPILLNTVGGAMYALTCGAISFSFLALFVRFATRRRWICDSLSDNEYGMYLIHYMFRVDGCSSRFSLRRCRRSQKECSYSLECCC